jgi:hypothetical protein
VRARAAGRAALADCRHHLAGDPLLRVAVPGHPLLGAQAAPPGSHHPGQGERTGCRTVQCEHLFTDTDNNPPPPPNPQLNKTPRIIQKKTWLPNLTCLPPANF